MIPILILYFTTNSILHKEVCIVLPLIRYSKTSGACFGVGMGCMEATCGAQMVQGMKKYENKPMLGQAKEMLEAFKKLSGATICGDLKGAKNGVVICSCDDCVRNGVTIAEKCL